MENEICDPIYDCRTVRGEENAIRSKKEELKITAQVSIFISSQKNIMARGRIMPRNEEETLLKSGAETERELR